MKKVGFISLMSLLVFSCHKVEINRNNEVKITRQPQHIKTTEYSFLKDTFKLNEIEKASINYGALTPQYQIAIGIDHGENRSVLYSNNCRSQYGFSLIIQDSLGFQKIGDREGLKRYFAPIKTKEEALSYACAFSGLTPRYSFDQISGYRTFVDTIQTTASRLNKDGFFEVNLFDYKACGCGPHTYSMVKYRVSKNGDISELESTDLFQDPEEDDLCID